MSSAYNKLISTAARTSLLSHIDTAPAIKLYFILIFGWKKLLYFSYEDILQEKIVKGWLEPLPGIVQITVILMRLSSTEILLGRW